MESPHRHQVRIRPAAQINHLRAIRNRVLTRSPQGLAYIALFERHRQELTALLLTHKDILGLVDIIVRQVQAEFPEENPAQGRLTQNTARNIRSLIEKVAKVASAELAVASARVRDEVSAFVGKPPEDVLDESWKLISRND